jgi:hypothetical protein
VGQLGPNKGFGTDFFIRKNAAVRGARRGKGARAIVATVTAHASDAAQPGANPLAPGASPHAIRAALLESDRGQFDAAYAAALEIARERLELIELFDVLEQWRRVAVLQSDRESFRAVARRAAELVTGEPVPDDEPLEITRAKAGL